MTVPKVALIGLCGYGGAGKDEVGRVLMEQHGYHRFAKGDLLKSTALKINPLVLTANPDSHHSEWTVDYLRPIVEREGWEAAKRYDMVRRFLQDMADEVVSTCGRDVWNDALYDTIDAWRSGFGESPPGVVMTRLSLALEAERCVAEGGAVVRVARPGYGPANDHPNEVALDDWPVDYVIVNDGGLSDLDVKVNAMLAALRQGG